MSHCIFCEKEVGVEKPGRSESCPHCDASLHCCYQCHFYDPSAHNECHESQADRVLDKEKANFCDYFIFNPKAAGKTHGKEKKEEVLKKLESLFKK